jgi:hypothetical protein
MVAASPIRHLSTDTTTSPTVNISSEQPFGDHSQTERMLLIASHTSEAETCCRAPRALHIDSTWVRSGREGLTAARRGSFALVLMDLERSDIPSLDIARVVHTERCPAPVFIIGRPPKYLGIRRCPSS